MRLRRGSHRASLSLAAREGAPGPQPPPVACRSPALEAVASFRGGWLGIGAKRPKRILLDEIEDIVEAAWRYAKIVAIPAFHLVRLGFGLSLMFYGMAFRAFAFHVIVFRIAGMTKVRRPPFRARSRPGRGVTVADRARGISVKR